MEPEVPPEYVSTPVELEVCNTCGRNFNIDTLARHEEICVKHKNKSIARKPFDSCKHRAMGTDLENYNIQRNYKTTEDRLKMIAYERNAQKKKQWKRKHEDFITTIRTAREYDIARQTGINLPAPKPSAPNPDYVLCPYCKRRFQEHVAERHIPFCKEKNSQNEFKSMFRTTGSTSLKKRLIYKPPRIRKRMETEGHSERCPPAPPLIQRRKMCASTYTVRENGHGTDNYPGEQGLIGNAGARFGYEPSTQLVGGTSMQHLPGNTNGHFKPHPPSKLPPPKFCSRLVHLKQTPENSRTESLIDADRSHGNHTGMANGYLSELDEQDSASHMDSCSSHSIGQQQGRTREGELAYRDRQQHPLLSKINSNTTLSDTSILQHNGYTSDSNYHVTSMRSNKTSVRDRSVNSNSSSTGSGSGRTKHSQLNVHGMTMSKFCYECGSGFPVPQAKYCCECGTKRI